MRHPGSVAALYNAAQVKGGDPAELLFFGALGQGVSDNLVSNEGISRWFACSELPALEMAYTFEDRVIIEQYIDGREFSIGVIDGEALPCDRDRAQGRILRLQEQVSGGFSGRNMSGRIGRKCDKGDAVLCRDGISIPSAQSICQNGFSHGQ